MTTTYTTSTRRATPDTARDIVRKLDEHGVAIPAEIAAVLAALDVVEGLRPKPPTNLDVVAAFLAGDARTAEDIALKLSLDRRLQDAWTEARIQAGQRLRAAITANGHELAASLARVAAPHIAAVEHAATLDTLDTVALLREGRSADAEAAARYAHEAAALANLYNLRDRVTEGATYGQSHGHDCRTWRDPRIPRTRPQDTPAAAFRQGLQAGGLLWFPTPLEADKRAAEIAGQEEAERHKAEAESSAAVRHAAAIFY